MGALDLSLLCLESGFAPMFLMKESRFALFCFVLLQFLNRIGSLPLDITNLMNLTELTLSGGALTGPIPKEIRQLGGLQELNLRNNELSESIPTEICKLGNLHSLKLQRNHLTGTCGCILAVRLGEG